MQFGFLFALFFAVLVTFFALGNSHEILVNFFIAEVQLPTAALILMATAAGALITFLLGSFKYLKSIRQARVFKKELKVEKETNVGLETQLVETQGMQRENLEQIRKLEMEKDALQLALQQSKKVQKETLYKIENKVEENKEEHIENENIDREEKSEIETEIKEDLVD